MAHAHGFAPRLGDAYPQGQSVPSGKFGRMFPMLEPLLPPDDALRELGSAMLDREPSSLDGDNKAVPAGYTYLAQFIDHDITFDPTSLQETHIDPMALWNFRTPKLDLDSMYGTGPSGQPYLFQRDLDHTRITSDLFLIGKTASKPGKGDRNVKTGLPFDLPRGPEGFALIGDPRNDNNLIVAQMHLAFLRFHNQVVTRLRHCPRKSRQRTLFEEARELVVWHYQRIILDDFLPLLLDADQLKNVLKEGRKFYRPQGEPFIPVEFSAAAYRFGHSMVREEYDYNRVFTFQPGGKKPAALRLLFHFTGLSGNGEGVPIPSDRIIDWRRFFKVGKGAEVGLSRQIDPFLAPPLRNLPEMPAPTSLAVRNLQRGKMLGLPSGQSVARVLRLSPLTSDEIGRGRDGRVAKRHGFDVETPLWYYVLKEAQVRGSGQRLGPVGSRILAEVFVGLLELDSGSFLVREPLWTPTLPRKQVNHFTMADLLDFIGDLSPIDNSSNLNNTP